jgi:mRNA interferase MazF
LKALQAPKWGDIIWINFSPQRGHEQAGERPALIISNSRYNSATGLVVVCPITSQIKNYPTEILLPDLTTKGVVLANQIRTLDWREMSFRFQEKAPADYVTQVIELITTIFEKADESEEEE